MYMVYEVSMDRRVVNSGDNIIAIYARRAGAILRLETLAHGKPGTLFAVGVLPEGVKPCFANVKSVYAQLSVSESEVSNGAAS